MGTTSTVLVTGRGSSSTGAEYDLRIRTPVQVAGRLVRQRRASDGQTAGCDSRRRACDHPINGQFSHEDVVSRLGPCQRPGSPDHGVLRVRPVFLACGMLRQPMSRSVTGLSGLDASARLDRCYSPFLRVGRLRDPDRQEHRSAVRECALPSARSTSREGAYRAADLCPILGAQWERRATVRCGQAASAELTVRR